jgi:hypothetical protein
MPEYAELIISDCRKIREQIIAEQGENADALLAFTPYTRTAAVIAGLADALDKAQRERDEWKALHEKHCGLACCDAIDGGRARL